MRFIVGMMLVKLELHILPYRNVTAVIISGILLSLCLGYSILNQVHAPIATGLHQVEMRLSPARTVMVILRPVKALDRHVMVWTGIT